VDSDPNLDDRCSRLKNCNTIRVGTTKPLQGVKWILAGCKVAKLKKFAVFVWVVNTVMVNSYTLARPTRSRMQLVIQAGEPTRRHGTRPRQDKANSAFHPSGVGKWVPASAGKAKAGMGYFVSGWTRGAQVKLWDPFRTNAIPADRLRGIHDKALYKSTFTLHYIMLRHRRDRSTQRDI